MQNYTFSYLYINIWHFKKKFRLPKQLSAILLWKFYFQIITRNPGEILFQAPANAEVYLKIMSQNLC